MKQRQTLQQLSQLCIYLVILWIDILNSYCLLKYSWCVCLSDLSVVTLLNVCFALYISRAQISSLKAPLWILHNKVSVLSSKIIPISEKEQNIYTLFNIHSKNVTSFMSTLSTNINLRFFWDSTLTWLSPELHLTSALQWSGEVHVKFRWQSETTCHHLTFPWHIWIFFLTFIGTFWTSSERNILLSLWYLSNILIF